MRARIRVTKFHDGTTMYTPEYKRFFFWHRFYKPSQGAVIEYSPILVTFNQLADAEEYLERGLNLGICTEHFIEYSLFEDCHDLY